MTARVPAPVRAVGRGGAAVGRGIARVAVLVARVVVLLARGLVLLARGLALLGRGLWRGLVLFGRGAAAGGRGAGRLGRRIGAASAGHPVGDWLAWFVAVVLSFITFGTSASAFDVGRYGWGLMPFIGALIGLPFGLVVRRPVLGWAISVASAFLIALAMPLIPTAPWPWHIVHGLIMLALLFGVAARERLRVTLPIWLGTVALWRWALPGDQAAGWIVGVTGVAVMGWLAGRLARTRGDLRRQTRLNEEERARRVRLQERARIARDLHDIVAHHMSLIVVQAETASFRVPDLPAPAQAELTSIGEAARSALTETRALLTVLRQDDDAVRDAPQPGVEQVSELVVAARRAGARVQARLPEVNGRLRPGTSLAAYRIVQEALSNAARHAPGAAVRIEIDLDDEECRVDVTNEPSSDGPTPPLDPDADPDGPRHAGHGITGMSERAAAEGGTLSAGRTQDGGFAVRATLPIATA